MNHATRKYLIPALMAGVCLISVGPVKADMTFTAILDGASAGTPAVATGAATFILNTVQDQVTYTITLDGLKGVELASHVHNAAPGMIGPQLINLPLGTVKNGTWAVGNFEVRELRAGRIYINIHTDSYGAGEIRGNLMDASVAADTPSWGAVKALFR